MGQDTMVRDIKQARGAMTGDPEFMASGIDEAFVDMFANNMDYVDKLPESTKDRIRKHFLKWRLRSPIGRQWPKSSAPKNPR